MSVDTFIRNGLQAESALVELETLRLEIIRQRDLMPDIPIPNQYGYHPNTRGQMTRLLDELLFVRIALENCVKAGEDYQVWLDQNT